MTQWERLNNTISITMSLTMYKTVLEYSRQMNTIVHIIRDGLSSKFQYPVPVRILLGYLVLKHDVVIG